jgi:cytochrome c553
MTPGRFELAIPLVIAIAAAAARPAAAQGKRDVGRRKAKPCVVCHGPLGISQAPDTPHVAGQPEVYFVEQMKAYRSGKRVHPEMNVVAKPLTDADIDDMAAWYASIAVSASAGPRPPASKAPCPPAGARSRAGAPRAGPHRRSAPSTRAPASNDRLRRKPSLGTVARRGTR